MPVTTQWQENQSSHRNFAGLSPQPTLPIEEQAWSATQIKPSFRLSQKVWKMASEWVMIIPTPN